MNNVHNDFQDVVRKAFQRRRENGMTAHRALHEAIGEAWSRFIVVDRENPEFVVINPDDREAVERLFDAIFMRAFRQGKHRNAIDKDYVQAALRELANPTPPEPEEPTKPEEPKGIGAVVLGSDGNRYIRLRDAEFAYPWATPWQHRYGWSDVPAVRVLSEGVTS